jgi:hypothetical protein
MTRTGLASLVLTLALASSALTPASAQNVSEQEVYEIAKEAYVYAYPLVLSAASLRQFTNYAEPTGIVT